MYENIVYIMHIVHRHTQAQAQAQFAFLDFHQPFFILFQFKY